MYTRNNKVAKGRKFKSARRFYWARTWFAEGESIRVWEVEFL